MVVVTYHGHACLELAGQAGKVVVDPFLAGNPLADCKADDIEVDAILVSHAHADHMGDAVSIAKRLEIPIIGTAEVANYFQSLGLRSHAMHIGGQHRFEFGRVRLTVAHHGNTTPDGRSLGLACGFVVDFEPTTVYFAGDTGLTLDMKLLDGVLETIDLACLPIGGNFTMDIPDAVRAVEFINPRTVMPMHYGTWPVIEADPYDFAKRVACKTLVLKPGQSAQVGWRNPSGIVRRPARAGSTTEVGRHSSRQDGRSAPGATRP